MGWGSRSGGYVETGTAFLGNDLDVSMLQPRNSSARHVLAGKTFSLSAIKLFVLIIVCPLESHFSFPSRTLPLHSQLG